MWEVWQTLWRLAGLPGFFQPDEKKFGIFSLLKGPECFAGSPLLTCTAARLATGRVCVKECWERKQKAALGASQAEVLKGHLQLLSVGLISPPTPAPTAPRSSFSTLEAEEEFILQAMLRKKNQTALFYKSRNGSRLNSGDRIRVRSLSCSLSGSTAVTWAST